MSFPFEKSFVTLSQFWPHVFNRNWSCWDHWNLCLPLLRTWAVNTNVSLFTYLKIVIIALHLISPCLCWSLFTFSALCGEYDLPYATHYLFWQCGFSSECLLAAMVEIITCFYTWREWVTSSVVYDNVISVSFLNRLVIFLQTFIWSMSFKRWLITCRWQSPCSQFSQNINGNSTPIYLIFSLSCSRYVFSLGSLCS